MDDFLHNLRSGKLKQHDRGRRDYSDYKGPQRRVGNERRRTDYYAKVTGENFALVKDSLDRLAEQQKRIADALMAGSDTESRIADALESIAARLNNLKGVDGGFSDPQKAPDSGSGSHAGGRPASEPEAALDLDWHISGDKLAEVDRPKVLNNISSMREAGLSWEKIARRMIEKRVPTLSGKGVWRGTAVKKLWDAQF
ncbi:MAG: hypothetical protein PVG51_09755 [Desulfosarcina sp.]|jgi:hypothetical protein